MDSSAIEFEGSRVSVDTGELARLSGIGLAGVDSRIIYEVCSRLGGCLIRKYQYLSMNNSLKCEMNRHAIRLFSEIFHSVTEEFTLGCKAPLKFMRARQALDSDVGGLTSESVREVAVTSRHMDGELSISDLGAVVRSPPCALDADLELNGDHGNENSANGMRWL